MTALREAVAGAILDRFSGGSSGLDEMAEAIALDHADAALAAIEAAGFVVVPREPTREMWAAAGTAVVETRNRSGNHDHMSEAVWKAMLAAAQPQKECKT